MKILSSFLAKMSCFILPKKSRAPAPEAVSSPVCVEGKEEMIYPKDFEYKEIIKATNKLGHQIGEGGFGKVYKGRLETGQEVAVKILNHGDRQSQGKEEFMTEVLLLSIMRHENLINLVGYCMEGHQRILVYQYMKMGSLENHLFSPFLAPLSWEKRLKICVGIARGLEYLHNASPPVIYRDMKSANVLLDELFKPKLSDFGLAKVGPVGDRLHVTTRVMGTQGYCAPEYAMTGRLTFQSDVYSLGVVLLELVTGKLAFDPNKAEADRHLVSWARRFWRDERTALLMVDSRLRGKYCKHSFLRIVQIAKQCLSENVHNRPPASAVAESLHSEERHCTYRQRRARAAAATTAAATTTTTSPQN